jgi:hypothetical protein
MESESLTSKGKRKIYVNSIRLVFSFVDIDSMHKYIDVNTFLEVEYRPVCPLPALASRIAAAWSTGMAEDFFFFRLPPFRAD